MQTGTFSAASAGGIHTCGLRSTGAIECWGSSNSGRTTVPAGSYSAVSAGHEHSCGIKTDGTIACWGVSTYDRAPATRSP